MGRAGGVANTGLAVRSRGSYQETAPRKTDENIVKHCDGDVGLVLANHCSGGESSVVVQTLYNTIQ